MFIAKLCTITMMNYASVTFACTAVTLKGFFLLQSSVFFSLLLFLSFFFERITLVLGMVVGQSNG